MNSQAWQELCLSQPPVQKYLKWVVLVEHGKNLKAIKVLVSLLVESSARFSGKASILKWLYYQSENIESTKCASLNDILAFIQRAFRQLSKATSENMQHIQEKITVCLSEVITGLDLLSEYDKLFIMTLLYPLSYDTSECFFDHLLTFDDLKYLNNELNHQLTEFERVKSINSTQVQAYLFHLTVSFLDSRFDSEFQHMCVNHLQYLQRQLKQNCDTSLISILDKYKSYSFPLYRGYNWPDLQTALLEVEASTEAEKKVIGSHLLDFLTKVQTGAKYSPKPHYSQNHKVGILFNMLGLSQHYPQKLTRI